MNHRLTCLVPILVIILAGCSLFDEEKGPKDPRDYTRTIDTLYYPGDLQTNMDKIWASSPEDVYVIGHSGVLSGSMWHYNGRSWIAVPIIELDGGPISNTNYSLNDIYGFSKYDVWANKNTVFVIGYTNSGYPSKTLVIKGE